MVGDLVGAAIENFIEAAAFTGQTQADDDREDARPVTDLDGPLFDPCVECPLEDPCGMCVGYADYACRETIKGVLARCESTAPPNARPAP